VESFDSAVRLAFKPDDFRQLLAAAGRDRKRAPEVVQAIFNAPAQKSRQEQKGMKAERKRLRECFPLFGHLTG